MKNKESDLSKIFTNEKNSIKISSIVNKRDLFRNNIFNDNKISLFNNNEKFKNLLQKENNKEEFIQFEITYKYKPDEYDDESKDDVFEDEEDEKTDKLKILDKIFINKNKDKCKIIYKNKEYELEEYFEDIDNNYNKKDEITIKLRITKYIVEMGNMFYECDSLRKSDI